METPADLAKAIGTARDLLARQQTAEALAVLEPLIEHHSTSIELLELAASAFYAAGRGKRMIACLDRLTQLAPDRFDAWMGLGNMRAHFGAWEAAVTDFNRAAALAPTRIEPLLGLALVFNHLDRPAEAVAAYRRVLALDPGNAKAKEHIDQFEEGLETLARMAFTAGEARAYDEARENYEAVVFQEPKSILALSRLLALDGIEGRLAEAERHHRALADALAATDLALTNPNNLALAAYQSIMRPLPRLTYDAVCGALDKQMSAQGAKLVLPPAQTSKASGRLRIGYLSHHLRDHPIGHVTAKLFGAHDRAKFEVHVFYMPAGGANPYTDEIRAGAEHFHTAGTEEEMASLIARQNLDILVYLDGYMAPFLLPVIARRVAPIQIYWLGHAGSCEIAGIDYFIADNVVVPPGEERLIRAKVVRLECYHPASPHTIGPAMSRAEAGLPEQGFVFCAFNNPEKIDASTFHFWMRILTRVPKSVLWLSRSQSPALIQNLRGAAQERGVDGARLVFAERVPDKATHLARHRLAGLFLDTFGLNASTTALDALWAGLPVLTVTGDRFASRIATTFLKTLDLADLICESPAAFEDRAANLAFSPEALGAITQRLATNRADRPLFQIEHFCRGLEATLAKLQAEHRR